MELTGKHNGHDVIAYPLNGGTFESPSLGNTRFNSADALQKALDKLDAEEVSGPIIHNKERKCDLRKSFAKN